MHLEEVHKDIMHVSFPTQYELNSTFMRFQEHYENPQFKGKVFTREEFEDWYVKNTGKGKFSYYEDWTGCNVPSHVYSPFYEGRFNPLSKKEEALLSLLEPYKPRRFYSIGTFGENDSLDHEIAHGFFYLDDSYKKEAIRILSTLNKRDKKELRKVLNKMGYDSEFFNDEIHAYFVGGVNDLRKEGFNDSDTKKQQRQMKALFREYRKR